MNLSRFGRRIRQLRIGSKMTQADVAKAVGVGQTAVSQWEIGSTAPTLANVFELARIFDVKPGTLLDGDGRHAADADSETLATVG